MPPALVPEHFPMAPTSLSELEASWPEFAAILAAEGSQGLVSRLSTYPDRHERHMRFRFVIRKLGVEPKVASSLDAMIAVGDAAIASALSAAHKHPDEKVKWT